MILDTLAQSAVKRNRRAKQQISPEEMKSMAEAMNHDSGFPFRQALQKEEIQFICEVKKASPSKGIIAEEFPYLEIAKSYEAAGAVAISVLTETDYFLGSTQYLKEIAEQVSVPVLRKDFIVDEYQIYEAKVLGASAILLIVSLLEPQTILRYGRLAEELGMDALVEVHDEEEMEIALEAGGKIIGVNNRNLKDFTVDIANSTRLRAMAPADRIFVAESGIQTAEDIKILKEANVNGVLIGETLMRCSDKKKKLDELRG